MNETQVRNLLAEELADPDLIRLTLSRPRPDSSYRKGQARRIRIADREVLQLALQTAKQEFHANLSEEERLEKIWNVWTEHFEHLHLFSRTKDLQFQRESVENYRVRRTRPSTPATALPVTEHNRDKEHLLPEGRPIPFLVEIGIMNRDGKVLAPKYHKFRQINRFVELVDDVTRDLPRDRELRMIDFGSGKSYLTFAVHDLFTRVRNRPCKIVGVDRNPDVVETCRGVAARLGTPGLEFRVGEIGTYPWDEPVDVVFSLHACDTATDDVLGAAALRQVPVILSAPCCQHELAPQLSPPDWQAFLQHGILRERLGALATDALRAAALEVMGYQTQLLEFVDLEHTPKNLLIRAVRSSDTTAGPALKIRNYQALRKALGIRRFHLEELLGSRLTDPVVE